VDAPLSTLSEVEDGITVAVWLNIGSMGDDNWVFSTGYTYFVEAAVPTTGGDVYWRAGNDSNDALTWNEASPAAWVGEWHHIAFRKDENAGTMSIYFDGLQADSKTGVISSLANTRNRPFEIGEKDGDNYVGKMDDFRIYDYPLSDSEIAALFRGEDLGIAWGPSPRDGDMYVAWDANLAWRPGDYAAQHKVFFGMDRDDVNDMTDPCATLSLGNELYDPGLLALDTEYFWRIDEVNGPNTWKGPVWRFKVADFVILDDFERYTIGDPDRIYYTWIDQRSQPWGEATGSWLSLATEPTYPVHLGQQAMSYEFNNNDPWADLSYSDACLPLAENGRLTNWTGFDVRLLTVFFYGQAENDANQTEQMYMGVSDTAGRYAEMRYGDHAGEALSDLKVEEWQSWDIPFVWFTDSNAAVSADIDFSGIDSVYIGFGDRFNPQPGGAGQVFFDDLRLSMPICRPEYGPAGDLNGDCFVGVADIGEMADQWLRGDVNVNPVTVPSDANLVARWKLDGDATDSSANGYHGTAEGSYAWVAGKDGQAIDLSGGWVVVDDNGVTPKLRPKHHVSVMAWINRVQASSDAVHVLARGGDDRETYSLEVNGDEGLTFFVRDANLIDDGKPKIYDIKGERKLPRNEWFHVAGTYDGNELTSYVNGEVQLTLAPGPNELYADVNDGLGIGGRYGSGGGRFEGRIDDVRVYDRPVTRAEIAYIASGGDGLIPLESEANFYDGEDPEVIDFKDYATLFDYWGDEQLWPPEPVP
jgi:hypothetical protein